MLKQRVIDAFEKRYPANPMDEDEVMIMMLVMTGDDKIFLKDINDVDKDSEIYQHFKPIINGFQFQIFLKRIELLTTLKISLGAFLLISQHLESPGNAVMYAFYLHHKLPPNTFVTYKEICENLFPFGFFSKEQLNNIWDAQKVKKEDNVSELTCYAVPDNLLDYKEIWVK